MFLLRKVYHGSDDLELAFHLPVRNHFAELTLLPLPGGGIVIDTSVAEPFARN